MTDDVRVVKHDDLEPGPPTPGMDRQQAFAQDDVWFGEVHTDPDTQSGWHHHGDHATYGRVVEGRLRFEFGPAGVGAVEAGAGDYFIVPPHTVHREGNPGSEPGLIVLARVGSGPTVINVDGPEPE